MMIVKINITPMSMKNGVLGLPIDSCRNWNALDSVKGCLIYAGIESEITFTAKHVDIMNETASAWQFTINNSIQYAQLKQDGIYTYAVEKMAGEKLVCDMSKTDDGIVVLKVVSVEKHPETPELKKLALLVKQGVRVQQEEKTGDAPKWNAPSEWISFSAIKDYSDVKDCIYLWVGSRENDDTMFLYVGIVGDTRQNGESKRTLSQRLSEEQKKYHKEYGVTIDRFRYCSLNNANGADIPILLKTIEMAEITVLSSIFYCTHARDNIEPLFNDKKVILLNKSTSYKFVTK